MKVRMIPRRACLLFCASSLASCKVEEDPGRESKPSGTTPPKESASELPRRASDFPPRSRITNENVFPEAVLNSWGYITTKGEDAYHDIRSEKNYGKPGEAFYARLSLAKARFEDESEAIAEKNRMESLLKTEAGFKNYTQIIQRGDMLYSICATSYYTFLEHQPKLMDAVRAHLARTPE